MTTISKRDALQLAVDIKGAVITGHAVARQCGGAPGTSNAAIVGALEIVLGHFVGLHAGSETRAAIYEAFNYQPTETDFAAREARLAQYRSAA